MDIRFTPLTHVIASSDPLGRKQQNQEREELRQSVLPPIEETAESEAAKQHQYPTPNLLIPLQGQPAPTATFSKAQTKKRLGQTYEAQSESDESAASTLFDQNA